MKKSPRRLLINEFARLCQVTAKTLRHYEKMGLIHPHEVDGHTGYRYYRVEQMQQVTTIIRLKHLGYSLDEISILAQAGDFVPETKSLKKKIDLCDQEIALITKRRELLTHSLQLHLERPAEHLFSIKRLPAALVASYRGTIRSYDELGPLCVQVIGPEMARLGCTCSEPGYCFTFEHHPFRETNIDIEYCEQVDERKPDSALIKFKRIPAVKKAMCLKHYGPYKKLYGSYAALFERIVQKGYEVGGHPRAVYIDGPWNCNNPAKWLTEIQVPINSHA